MDSLLTLIQKKVEYLQKRLVLLEQENRSLQKENAKKIKEISLSLIEFCDAFDNVLLNCTNEASNGQSGVPTSFLRRVKKLRRRFKGLLTSYDINEIGFGNGFDSKKAKIVEVRNNPSHENGHVLEVVRSGYESSSTVLRPAEIIVVKNE